MKVMLISANTEQLQMPVLPVGLACVAAAVARAGHEIEFVNLMTQQDGSELPDALSRFQPDVIGISVRNIDNQSMEAPKFLLEPVRGVVAECRKRSSAPIVLGGAGFSIFPEAVLEYLGADMGIQGEGEGAFPMLLERLAEGRNISDAPGIFLPSRARQSSEEDQSIKRSEPLSRFQIDDFPLPLPNVHLHYPAGFPPEQVMLPFQTRRGCPMRCSYCSTSTIEGAILRKRSIDRVLGSLARFADAGFKRFFFVDNTFNLPPSYAEALCDGITKAALEISWMSILYPWKMDEKLVAKMARAGCTGVSLGFESGSESVLRALNKRFGLNEVRRASEVLRAHGILRNGFLLLGGPGETRETVLESLHFADSLNLESMKVTVGIRIYPYTAVAQAALKQGMISPEDSLLQPAFYLEKQLEGWLDETVQAWMKDRPNWQR